MSRENRRRGASLWDWLSWFLSLFYLKIWFFLSLFKMHSNTIKFFLTLWFFSENPIFTRISDLTGRQGSVSVTDRGHSATVSTLRIVRESVSQCIYLGNFVSFLPLWVYQSCSQLSHSHRSAISSSEGDDAVLWEAAHADVATSCSPC